MCSLLWLLQRSVTWDLFSVSEKLWGWSVCGGSFGANSSFMSIIWKAVGMNHTIKHSVTSVLVLKTSMKLLLGDLSNCNFFSLVMTLCYCCMTKLQAFCISWESSSWSHGNTASAEWLCKLRSLVSHMASLLPCIFLLYFLDMRSFQDVTMVYCVLSC